MYLGMVLILAGVAILLGSFTPYVGPVVFTVIMEKVFIEVEEKMIEDIFQEEYLQYKNKVRKWI